MEASDIVIQNINKINIFSTLSLEEIKEILKFASCESYNQDQVIFNENDPGSALYIVLSGKVKIYRVLSDNSIHEIANFCPYEVFGEMSFMDNQVRSASAQALSDTTLVRLSAENFVEFSKFFPGAAFRFHKDIISEIQSRLRKTNDRYSYHIIWGKTMKSALAKNYEELLQSNIELSASRNFLYSVINNSSDLIFVINESHDIILFNSGAETILKYKSDEMNEKNAQILFYDLRNYEEFLNNIARDKSLEHFEMTLKTSDGQKVIADTSAFVLYNGNDAKLFGDGIVVIARDITQKKALENQIIQNEKMIFLGKTISEIIHDIKNPLTIVQLAKDYLQMKVSDLVIDELIFSQNFSEDFKKIDESIERIQKIIVNTLDFAKVVPTKQSEVNLCSVIEKSINLSCVEAKNKNITFKFEKPDFEPLIIGNSSQLEQVFVNLLTNSIHALNKSLDGVIDISITRSNRFILEVRLKDNGCGISPEDIPYIFEPFYTTKSSAKGTGLGLSICQAIISQHKGNITCESKQNVFSEFVIKFPASC